MTTFWMSFCDAEKPDGSKFIGVALVEATSWQEALTVSHMTGCNPGGEIKFIEIEDEDIPPHMQGPMSVAPRNTLMNRDDLAQFGLMG